MTLSETSRKLYLHFFLLYLPVFAVFEPLNPFWYSHMRSQLVQMHSNVFTNLPTHSTICVYFAVSDKPFRLNYPTLVTELYPPGGSSSVYTWAKAHSAAKLAWRDATCVTNFRKSEFFHTPQATSTPAVTSNRRARKYRDVLQFKEKGMWGNESYLYSVQSH